ncbi:MAG: 2-dehydro-3-deoxygalactonokinase [Devosia sp.]
MDWGTSNLRVWGIDANDSVTFALASDQGMSKLKRDQFAGALLTLLSREIGSTPDPANVLICGMAGARQGWLEAPYVETPAALTSVMDKVVTVSAGPLRCRILPGVAQKSAGSEDVMRGEETQLLGLLRLRPGFEGVAVLPGTHSKWVEIAAGRIVRFATAMTGELFDVLSAHSVLRHSLGGDIVGPATEDGVDAGLTAALNEPQLLTSLLFRTRAAALLSGRGADWCAGYLSGLLVGTEIAGHRNWLGAIAVPLIGSDRLVRLYGAALGRIGVESVAIDATAATLAGLSEAHRSLVTA